MDINNINFMILKPNYQNLSEQSKDFGSSDSDQHQLVH